MNITPHLKHGIFVYLLVFQAGCGPATDAGPRQPPLPAVRAHVLVPETFLHILELTGSIEAATTATLSSPAEGPIAQLAVREGDRVETDQLLLRIGRTSGTDAELAAAEEDWKTRQREFERIQKLVKQRTLAIEQLDIARAALERSSSQLSKAREVTRDFRIAAPWAGTVSRLHVAEGRYVAPRMPLLEMFDPASLLLRFQVPERYAFEIEPGQELTARFDAFPGKPMSLQVTRAWPELDRRLRSRTFEAALPTDRISFAPGQFVRIALQLERVEAAITIPATAVLTLPDGHEGVYVVDDTGKVEARPIRIGGESRGRLWITQGLEAGEALVVEGQQNLKSGQAVRQVQPPEPR